MIGSGPRSFTGLPLACSPSAPLTCIDFGSTDSQGRAGRVPTQSRTMASLIHHLDGRGFKAGARLFVGSVGQAPAVNIG